MITISNYYTFPKNCICFFFHVKMWLKYGERMANSTHITGADLGYLDREVKFALCVCVCVWGGGGGGGAGVY